MEQESVDSIGYVYILHRKDNNGIVKIGYTSKTAESRANNYTDGDWAVHKHFPMPVWLARLTERATHKNLQQYWLNPKITGGSASEIFTCSLEIAENGVEISYLEQLEKVMKSLKVPEVVTKLILSKYGFSQSTTLDSIIRQIENKKEVYENEVSTLRANSLEKLKEVERKFLLEENNLKNELDNVKKQLNIVKEENEKLTNNIIVINNMSEEELQEKEKLLRIFGDKKINYNQFEVLRDNYRKALDLIEIYRVKEFNRKIR